MERLILCVFLVIPDLMKKKKKKKMELKFRECISSLTVRKSVEYNIATCQEVQR